MADEMELQVRDGGTPILLSRGARVGWAEAAQLLSQRGDSGLLDPPTPTRFDEDDWEW